MADYVPTTLDVRGGYSASQMTSAFYAGGEEQLMEARAEFDRWLDGVIREAKAEALEEAADVYSPTQIGDYTVAWLRARAELIRGGVK